MALMVKKAPRFVEVQGSHANTETKSVDILFLAEDDEKYAIELDPSILGALVSAISGEANALRSKLPELANSGDQALQVLNMSAAMAPSGDLAWKISLEGGLEVNLAFSSIEFDELFQQMEDVRQLLHGNRH